MMIRKLSALTLLALAAPAMAGDLSYTYVQGGYQRIDIDDDFIGSIDGDGFGLGFSFEVGENFFIAGSYGTAELDTDAFFGLTVDYDQTDIGLGYHGAVSDKTDFYGILSWVKAEASISGFASEDDDGYGLTVGLRSMVTDKVELEGHIGYVDLGDSGDGTAVGVGALYAFTPNFAAGATVDFDEDVTTYGIGARVYFGR